MRNVENEASAFSIVIGAVVYGRVLNNEKVAQGVTVRKVGTWNTTSTASRTTRVTAAIGRTQIGIIGPGLAPNVARVKDVNGLCRGYISATRRLAQVIGTTNVRRQLGEVTVAVLITLGIEVAFLDLDFLVDSRSNKMIRLHVVACFHSKKARQVSEHSLEQSRKTSSALQRVLRTIEAANNTRGNNRREEEKGSGLHGAMGSLRSDGGSQLCSKVQDYLDYD
jgi:hypothetical protein